MLLDLSSYLTTFERSASPYVDVVELINNPCYFLIIFVGLYLRARIFVLRDGLDSLDFVSVASRSLENIRMGLGYLNCAQKASLFWFSRVSCWLAG